MAQRGAGKTRGRTARADVRSGGPPGAGRESAVAPDTDPQERIRQLEAELARIKAELAAALARNKVLEENNEQVRNRIDWVIDSLHNLLEK